MTQFCGVSNAGMVAARFGKTRFQEQRNDYYKNGFDSLLNELAKFGLGKRDVVSNINFFSKVTTDDAGDLHFHVNHSKEGSYVDLRFEMTTLVVLSTCQHPMDPSLDYDPRPCSSRRVCRRAGRGRRSLPDEVPRKHPRLPQYRDALCVK